MADECKFHPCWQNKCKEEAKTDGMCEKHIGIKCCVCGEQATNECSHTGQFVCGAPLCPNCTGHTDISKPHGAWGFMNHSHIRRPAPEGESK